RAAFRIPIGGDHTGRLVKQEQARALDGRDFLAVEFDAVMRTDIDRRSVQHLTVEPDAAGRDQFLGVATRGHASPCETPRDTFARVNDFARFDCRLALPPARTRCGEILTLPEQLALAICLRIGPALAVLALAEWPLVAALPGRTVLTLLERLALAICLHIGPALAILALAERALVAALPGRAVLTLPERLAL